MLLQSKNGKKLQLLSKSSVSYITNLVVAENSLLHYRYYLKWFPQLLQFRLPIHKTCQLKAKYKVKEHFTFKLSKDARKP